MLEDAYALIRDGLAENPRTYEVNRLASAFLKSIHAERKRIVELLGPGPEEPSPETRARAIEQMGEFFESTIDTADVFLSEIRWEGRVDAATVRRRLRDLLPRTGDDARRGDLLRTYDEIAQLFLGAFSRRPRERSGPRNADVARARSEAREPVPDDEELTPEEIRGYRVAQDRTQADLARELGVHTSTIQKWEAGSVRPRGLSRSALVRLLRPTSVPSGAPDGIGGIGPELLGLLESVDRLRPEQDDHPDLAPLVREIDATSVRISDLLTTTSREVARELLRVLGLSTRIRRRIPGDAEAVEAVEEIARRAEALSTLTERLFPGD